MARPVPEAWSVDCVREANGCAFPVDLGSPRRWTSVLFKHCEEVVLELFGDLDHCVLILRKLSRIEFVDDLRTVYSSCPCCLA